MPLQGLLAVVTLLAWVSSAAPQLWGPADGRHRVGQPAGLIRQNLNQINDAFLPQSPAGRGHAAGGPLHRQHCNSGWTSDRHHRASVSELAEQHLTRIITFPLLHGLLAVVTPLAVGFIGGGAAVAGRLAGAHPANISELVKQSLTGSPFSDCRACWPWSRRWRWASSVALTGLLTGAIQPIFQSWQSKA